MSPFMALRVISHARNDQVAFGASRHRMAGRTGWFSRD